MDFRTPYQLYMREHAPDLYRRLQRSGQLEARITELVGRANARLAEVIKHNGFEDDRTSIHMAEEVVLAELLAPLRPSKAARAPKAPASGRRS